MENILSISSPINAGCESNQPTIAQPPFPDLPAPLPSDLHLPNWLLAMLLLSTLANRLYQVLVVIFYIMRQWKKPSVSK
jgi:hypothetical protein